MSEERKETVSDYIEALFKMADNMNQPCEQQERQKVLVAAHTLKAAWERERVEIAVRAATNAVNLTDEKWRRDCRDMAKMREALEEVDKSIRGCFPIQGEFPARPVSPPQQPQT